MLELESKGSDAWERKPLVWSRMSLERVELPPLQSIEYKWRVSSNYIALHDLIISDGEIRSDSFSNSNLRDLRGLLTYAPEGHELSGWGSTSRRTNAVTTLIFDQALVETELEKANLIKQQETKIYFKNPMVEATMNKLVDATLGKYYISAIHAETLALLVAIELGLDGDSARATKNLQENRLSLIQGGFVKQYIHENLNTNITLSSLANLVGLSRFYFIRSFKATFDVTPYKYINYIRIEKAKEMLAMTDLPIAAISDFCGLRPVAHFSAAFRRATGTTPSQYRAENKKNRVSRLTK